MLTATNDIKKSQAITERSEVLLDGCFRSCPVQALLKWANLKLIAMTAEGGSIRDLEICINTEIPEASQWTTEQVAEWISDLGFPNYKVLKEDTLFEMDY